MEDGLREICGSWIGVWFKKRRYIQSCPAQVPISSPSPGNVFLQTVTAESGEYDPRSRTENLLEYYPTTSIELLMLSSGESSSSFRR